MESRKLLERNSDCTKHTFKRLTWKDVLLTVSANEELLYHQSCQGVEDSWTKQTKPQLSQRLDDPVSNHGGFLVYTPGCRIPDMNPLDSSVLKFIKDPPRIQCAEEFGEELVKSDLTHLYINEDGLEYYNISELSELKCCYTSFERLKMEKMKNCEYPGKVDSRPKWAKKCVPFSNSTKITDEFLKVECNYKNNSIYIDYHSFTPTKKVSRLLQMQKKVLKNKEAVSVLVLGIDSVSRLNLHRKMPETSRFLKDLGAIEMLGYNKVADNTFPNLIPVLTGLFEEELKRSCRPEKKCVFDSCNYVWDNFSMAGHVTGFGEEASFMGIFTYNRPGFYDQPTDYYMRIFDRQAHNEIGFKHMFNTNLCIGPRKNLVHLLNYVNKFTSAFKKHLSFGFFWSVSLTHDNLNLAQEADKEHKEFLEQLQNQGIFENTVLILMSDHGMRWGPIRKTYQGYMEERLPFLFVMIPNWFEKKYNTAVSNLKQNIRRLTTPFDLHETLNDLASLQRLQEDVLQERTRTLDVKSLPRGISLFLPVPRERTCETASILEHWCTCHQSEEISTSDPLVKKATEHVVHFINSLLKEYPQCAELELLHITSARTSRLTSVNVTMKDKGIIDFSVTFSTFPGKGMFEAHVRYDANTEQFKVVATISRINAYGSQSRCVDLAHLKLYCYCQDN